MKKMLYSEHQLSLKRLIPGSIKNPILIKNNKLDNYKEFI